MNLVKWFKQLVRSKPIRTPIRHTRRRLDLEQLEERCVPSVSGYRPIDEVGNNIANPTQATANTDLLRVSPAAYADGISALSLAGNPSARVVSDILNNQADPADIAQEIQTVDQNSLSDFGYAWGQFIDHDMDLTPTDATDTLEILADPNDPSQMGDQTFARSVTDPATGTSTSNPAQQVNAVTSYLDLSQVYGSTDAIAAALRTNVGGLLKTSPGNMLPYDNSTYFTSDQLALFNMANDSGAVPTEDLFVAGDVRANENVELTSLQTLFVRNHNLIATELQKEHPTWTDQQLYQEARKLNIAEYQMITYNDYLPDLLGANAMPKYTGYNANVDPAIATEFSTIAFRFGHSLLSSGIERADNNGQPILPNDPAGDDISLATDFFDPNVLNPNGVVDPLTGHISTDIGPILKGDADGVSQADDLLAINDIRDLLFGNGGQTDNGQDLMARDVERARDDGIGSYNQVRVAYGLAPVTSFAQITSNVQVQQELQEAYGTVDNIDPFEGGLAEDHVAGSDMGPLFTKILADQFTRLRSGDRYFYLNETFNQSELNILQRGNTLAKVIEANTNVTNLQGDVFLFKAAISGTVSRGPGQGGVAGITVQLEDASGDVLATTVTNSRGQYSFNQLSGSAADPEGASGVSVTGYYNVALSLPATMVQTSAAPKSIEITHGNANVSGVNFTVTNAATHFDMMVPQTVAVGKSFNVVIEAEDASNHLASGYTGTVALSLGTADAGATLPAAYTFTAADHGIHVFHVTLAATGSQTIAAIDTTTSSIVGQASLTVAVAGQVTHLAVIAMGPAAAGLPAPILVVALDALNNIVPGYTGTVQFASSDANATLPALYTFSAADHGRHLFWPTFKMTGIETLTATDAADSSITGTGSENVMARMPWRGRF